jgi:DNA helicase-4
MRDFVRAVFNPIKLIVMDKQKLVLEYRSADISQYSFNEFHDFLKVHDYALFSRIECVGTFGAKNITLLRWTKGWQARSQLSEANVAIALQLEEKIGSLKLEFENKLVNNFPRDSAIDSLNHSLSTFVTLYNSNIQLCKQYFQKSTLDFLNKANHLIPLQQSVIKLRESYEFHRLESRKVFFDKIESNPLTQEQRLAVIRSNDLNMVLAAAGTGKTSVIVAKALDLIDSGQLAAQDILILAYNKDASVELQERIEKRVISANIASEMKPHISTFHALGRKILVDSKVSTKISRFAEDTKYLDGWIHEWLRKYITSSPHATQVFLATRYRPIDPLEFENKEQYERYIRDNEYRALNGTQVRGYQELLIANWLFINGIQFEYEPAYVSKRRLEIGYDYKPDFHITGTVIYLEHFGISRDGSTRQDIDSVSYNENIRKKRELHREYGTVLLETYHYNWKEGNLESRLEELLAAHKIYSNPISEDEILAAINSAGIVEDSARILQKALAAIRVEQLSHDQIKQRIEESMIPNSAAHFELLSELEASYQKALIAEQAIDFDDMIVRASHCVQQKVYQPKWKFILVDEFQDISGARMHFLKSLIDHGPKPILTVVGDDWQAIYRFAGGKLELTTRFEQFIGKHCLTKLQKTFRYNNSIADTAGYFVMQNPEQYKKQIVAHAQVTEPKIFLLDSGDNTTPQSMALKAISVIEQLNRKKPGTQIAILARYRYLLNECQSVLKNHGIKNIKFWTFHGSKGLEADHCILLGFETGKTGFPNQNMEDEVVEALLPSIDNYPNSEERRLMYVALTRAKDSVCLIANHQAPSAFVNELLAPEYKIVVHSERFKKKVREIYKCPMCTDGFLKKLAGRFGVFYKCSSDLACRIQTRVCNSCGAPTIDDKHHSVCRNPDCGEKLKICPQCARPMKLRNGSYGQFYGCSGYGITEDQCRYTEKVH